MDRNVDILARTIAARNFRDQLVALDACPEAVRWVGNRTLEQAWRECERSDWMLWLLRELKIDTRECAGHFALRVWHLVPDESQLACAWAIGCALRGADDDESDAAAIYYAAAALAATRAAAHAADAADAALAATRAAAHAAYAAALAAAHATRAAIYYAAEYAVYPAAHAAERRAQCDIIRELIPLKKVRAALKLRTK